MASINSFLKKLQEQTYRIVEEEASKDLAKEDALSLVAGFVKDVKGKFKKAEDRVEILKSALKTLEFFVNEIEEDDDADDFEPDDTFDFDDDVEEPMDDEEVEETEEEEE